MSKSEDLLINEEIKASELRVVGEDGTQYGIVQRNEALKLAREAGLDLVLVAPNAKPPVAKIMDYGKYRYQQEKKQKEAKKKQKVIEIKEIKLSVNIAPNDMNYKIKHAIEFLKDEKHVKFRVFLKGREISEPEIGMNMLNKVWEMVQEYAIRDKEPVVEGRYVSMIVAPKPKKEEKKNNNKQNNQI